MAPAWRQAHTTAHICTNPRASARPGARTEAARHTLPAPPRLHILAPRALLRVSRSGTQSSSCSARAPISTVEPLQDEEQRRQQAEIEKARQAEEAERQRKLDEERKEVEARMKEEQDRRVKAEKARCGAIFSALRFIGRCQSSGPARHGRQGLSRGFRAFWVLNCRPGASRR